VLYERMACFNSSKVCIGRANAASIIRHLIKQIYPTGTNNT
jgi:hypothetical protein